MDCPYCGKPFERVRPNQVRCKSADCNRAYDRLWKQAKRDARPAAPPQPCGVCGTPYVPGRKNQTVCGAEFCAAEAKRRLATSLTAGRPSKGSASLTCVTCAAPFKGHFAALYCSRDCRVTAQRERNRVRTGIEPRQCGVCQAPMPIGPEYRYYCSDLCRDKANYRRYRKGYEAHPERRVKSVEARRAKSSDPAYREAVARRDDARAQRAASRALAAQAAALAEALGRKGAPRAD